MTDSFTDPDAPASARTRVLVDDELALTGVCGSVLVTCTRQSPTAGSIVGFRERLLAESQAQARPLFVLVVMGAPRPRYPEDVRAELRETWRQCDEQVRGVALVIRGDSFGAAIKRSFVSTMALLRLRRTPSRVVADVQEAVQWFVGLAGDQVGPIDPREIEDLVDLA